MQIIRNLPSVQTNFLSYWIG